MTSPTGPLPAPARVDVQIEICRRLALGESLRAICACPGMPGKSTVFEWLARDQDFRQAYSIAKAFLAETYAEEIIEISDDGRNDWIERERSEGGADRVLDHEHVQRSKLRVDSRKWLAAKLAPKKYGDSSTLRIGEAFSDNRERTPEEIAVRLAAIAADVERRKKNDV